MQQGTTEARGVHSAVNRKKRERAHATQRINTRGAAQDAMHDDIGAPAGHALVSCGALELSMALSHKLSSALRGSNTFDN